MTRPRSEVERTRAKLAICQSRGINCPVCSTYRARLAELGELHASVAPEHRAKSSGRLASDHESMARDGRVARAREQMESAFPGPVAAYDRATRQKLSAERAGKRIGRRSERGLTDIGMLFILMTVAVFIVALLVHQMAEQARCEERGGVFYCAYKSSCLCLAKGTVLP